jgi:hypothetical protein
MRRRTVVGSIVLIVFVVGMIVALRSHPAPPGPDAATPAPGPTAPPVDDQRADRLTAAFQHSATLPSTVRFGNGTGKETRLRFLRYSDDEPGYDSAKYMATGVLVRRQGDVVLDKISVTVQRVDLATLEADYPATVPSAFATCDPVSAGDGHTCTGRVFPDGTHAKVVRNPLYGQTAASDQTSGAPMGIETDLSAVLRDGTRLSVSVMGIGGAGIPMDDATMLDLATIPGLTGS